ncbi:hypothetical protein J6590_001192 [Homalodisca vitripennis]|nr:hypothetical protein J6590_001192 [Homalodisca vitripennis]
MASQLLIFLICSQTKARAARDGDYPDKRQGIAISISRVRRATPGLPLCPPPLDTDLLDSQDYVQKSRRGERKVLRAKIKTTCEGHDKCKGRISSMVKTTCKSQGKVRGKYYVQRSKQVHNKCKGRISSMVKTTCESQNEVGESTMCKYQNHV